MAAAWTTTRGERVWVWWLIHWFLFWFFFILIVFVFIFVDVVSDTVSQGLFGPSFPIFVHALD
jgi:hypothetical protein